MLTFSSFILLYLPPENKGNELEHGFSAIISLDCYKIHQYRYIRSEVTVI